MRGQTLPNRVATLWAVTAAVVCGAVPYINTLDLGFTYDDKVRLCASALRTTQWRMAPALSTDARHVLWLLGRVT